MATSIDHPQDFLARHVGSGSADVQEMLDRVGCESLDQLVSETVPSSIAFEGPLEIPEGVPEALLIAEMRRIASKNQVWRSYLGTGYSGTITPGHVREY